MNDPVQPQPTLKRSRASLLAHGEPLVWICGGALVVAVVMTLALLGYIFTAGMFTFWPGNLHRVELVNGKSFMGVVVEEESRPVDDGGDRTQYMSGNFLLNGFHFIWVDDSEVAERTLPDWAVTIESLGSGRIHAVPQRLSVDGEVVARDPEAILTKTFELLEEVIPRREERRSLEKHALGAINRETQEARMETVLVRDQHGTDSDEYRAAMAAFEAFKNSQVAARRKIEAQILELRERNQRAVLHLSAPRFSTSGDPHELEMPLAEIVRLFPANQLGFGGKLGVFIDRWDEFIFDDPRHANSEGGIWPAIIGTMTMTLFMVVLGVPFGVLAALYINEYAKSGWMISVVRIAINNLAGVPSIVYGVFGLGFFCYAVGGTIDEIFYPAYAAENTPYYGKGALIWASFTLALLTLPVVIVATEEALRAVPNSMREGSYGCGASKWQTIQRIILPRAMPGIMTGLILAVSRGAGEVAPLMLVGAAKVAEDLPVDFHDWSGSLGFIPTGPLHLERSFMHMGYHIFDLGFHSQNSEAAKPLVFTTTFLLILMVAVLNIFAIWLRTRMARRFEGGRF